MRVAPLGAFFSDDLDRAATEAVRSAEVSHAHADGIAGAVAVAIAAACIARDTSDETLWREVLARTPTSYTRDWLEVAAGLGLDADVQTAAHTLGTGARVCAWDTVPFCLCSLPLWVPCFVRQNPAVVQTPAIHVRPTGSSTIVPTRWRAAFGRTDSIPAFPRLSVFESRGRTARDVEIDR